MQYDLVFEGGGAKGMVFVGAMQSFERGGHTVGRLVGTSAGAITSTLLAAGYSSDEMLAALAEKEGERSVFAGFMGQPDAMDKAALSKTSLRAVLREIDLPFLPDRWEEVLDDKLTEWVAAHESLRHLFSFVERGGWYSADSFQKWMGRRLDTGTFKGAPRKFSGLNLAQYKAATGADLSLVASDLTGQEMLILNHVTAPDLPVVWAVRMSMNIPLLWQEVLWQAEWGTYRKRSMVGHAIVDGGLLSNFPLGLLISQDPRLTAIMGSTSSDGVMGMLIDEGLAIEGVDGTVKPITGLKRAALPTMERLSNLVNTTLSARDKLVIDAFEKQVVRLPAKGISTTEFDMPDARRELLVGAGRDAMAAHIQRLADEPVSFDIGPDPEQERALAAADRLAQKFLGD